MLADIRVGNKCFITSLSMVNKIFRRRLQDLGVTVGSLVTVKSKMPFGGPIMIDADGQRLVIRRNEAKLIGVEVS